MLPPSSSNLTNNLPVAMFQSRTSPMPRVPAEPVGEVCGENLHRFGQINPASCYADREWISVSELQFEPAPAKKYVNERGIICSQRPKGCEEFAAFIARLVID